MANHDSGATPPKGGGLWARLFGVGTEQSTKAEPAGETPQWDVAGPPATPAALATPLVPPPALPGLPEPVVPAEPLPADALPVDVAPPLAQPIPAVPVPPVALLPPVAAPLPVAPPVEAEAPVEEVELCPSCQTPRTSGQPFCGDCGWLFSAGKAKLVAKRPSSPTPSVIMAEPAATPVLKIKDRYEVRELINERAGVCRYRGVDHGGGARKVTIVWAALPEMAEAVPLDEPAGDDDEMLPTFDEPLPVANFVPAAAGPAFPSLEWERGILEKAQHPALPKVVDSFVDNNFEYLILEAQTGRVLWDAWDDPDASAEIRSR